MYLSTRSLGRVLKTSFHRDGKCHTAFTSEYAAQAQERFSSFESRYWEKWVLPDGVVVRAAQVVALASELRAFPDPKADHLLWLPPPKDGELSVVTVLLGKPGIDINLPPGAAPVAMLETPSRSAWLTVAPDAKTAEFDQLLENSLARVRVRLMLSRRAHLAFGCSSLEISRMVRASLLMQPMTTAAIQPPILAPEKELWVAAAAAGAPARFACRCTLALCATGALGRQLT
jgi:hypothetical protein